MTDSVTRKACKLLDTDTAFVVATIISHEGSLPRTAGTKMIISGDGDTSGTIGGGLLEARVTQKAVDLIQRQAAAAFMPFDLSFDNLDSMDMICGGQAEVLLDYISPGAETRALFSRWHDLQEEKAAGFLITAVYGGHDRIDRVDRGVIDQQNPGDVDILPPDLMEAVALAASGAETLRVLERDGVLIVIEPAVKPKAAFLFGAGHVAKFTAHLCALTGFQVTVLDDRAEFANTENFPDTHVVRVIPDFAQAFDGLFMDRDAFIVILTRGHLYDKTVLARALKTEAGYIGMIGSRKKRATIYGALEAEGYSPGDFEKVHSPIGLAIGAQSPEEIAVSIVAEMIQVRERMRHG